MICRPRGQGRGRGRGRQDRNFDLSNFNAHPFYDQRNGGRRHHNEGFKGRPRGRGGQGRPNQKNGFAHEGNKKPYNNQYQQHT